MDFLSIIILTFNEEIHIERCIRNAQKLTSSIFLVDSYSTDRTVEIAIKLGAEVYQNTFVNQATQFNWALESLPIKTDWILRLDADEYIMADLIEEIRTIVPFVSHDVTGFYMKRRHMFFGKWIKKGVYPVRLLRLFRSGKGISENRWMDEHIVVFDGHTICFKNDFVDHNLKSFGFWMEKHRAYAVREALEIISLEIDILGKEEQGITLPTGTMQKNIYSKLPLFWRALMYFIYRYFLRLGFLEGTHGFLWHFFQGLWYRVLIDLNVWRIKNNCGLDASAIKDFIWREHGIQLYHEQ